MRVKVDYRTGSKETYNRFTKTHPEISLSYKEWKKIIYTYNALFREYMLETGERAKMQQGFGYFAVNRKKLKAFKNFTGKNGNKYVNLPIDWAKTKKAGRYIYHSNHHTDGFKFKWIWFKKEARFALSDIWYFKPSRESSRLITTYVTKPEDGYAQIYKTWTRK